MNNHTKIPELAFIRVFCTIGIICFHFACHSEYKFACFLTYASASVGTILVSIFFILSGAVLYYNYNTISSVKVFYYKRWKALFPSFYICFLFFYLWSVIKAGTFIYGAPAWTLLLTVIGYDGYLLEFIPNYYIVGEWFLGAIISLYLIYPLLVNTFKSKKTILVSTVILLCIYIICLKFTSFSARNLFYCMFMFFVGMLIMKFYRSISNNIYIIFIALAVFFIPQFVNFKLSSIALTHLLGISLFIILLYVGSLLKRLSSSKFVKYLSKISFQMFLLQHVVIVNILQIYNPASIYLSSLTLLICILVTVIGATILKTASDILFKISFIEKIDKRLSKTVT